MTILIISFIVVTVLIFSLFSVYQSMEKYRIKIFKARERVFNLLRHRTALIPELADSVKGLAVQSCPGLAEVILWQNRTSMSNNTAEAIAANQSLRKALSRFFSETRQFPELNGNARFLKLQGDFGFIEEQLDQYKHEYNEEAVHFNKMICMFPFNLFATFFQIGPEQLLK